jgi:hypothetical protein
MEKVDPVTRSCLNRFAVVTAASVLAMVAVAGPATAQSHAPVSTEEMLSSGRTVSFSGTRDVGGRLLRHEGRYANVGFD